MDKMREHKGGLFARLMVAHLSKLCYLGKDLKDFTQSGKKEFN